MHVSCSIFLTLYPLVRKFVRAYAKINTTVGRRRRRRLSELAAINVRHSIVRPLIQSVRS